ncbi:MAG: hypothetical protein JRI44_05010 [Deltaproteobacteria bacterium]|nr:hypothetical protein [Deltaproteobacteria bacterium]
MKNKFNLFKSVIIFLLVVLTFFFQPNSLSAIETAPRITDREIIEALTRIEIRQNNLEKEIAQLRVDMNEQFRKIDKQFDRIDKQFDRMDKQFDRMGKQFDRMVNIISAIVIAFFGIVAVTIGFALWDRRTMIRPFEAKIKELEQTDTKLINALKELAKDNKRLNEVLRNLGIL